MATLTLKFCSSALRRSDDLIAPIGGMTTYYDFSVPEVAVNPRLIGHYEVLSGLDINVDVTD
jgi:hypothetical protein